MNKLTIITGGDPRNYLEFSEIRQEINKINHPSAPEIDYQKMESLALEMFKQNGVDLQTAAYYTFARTKLYGLNGFIEGCELIEALIVNQWPAMWPESETSRIDMLDWLNARVGGDIRKITFETNQLSEISQADRTLTAICQKLASIELKRPSRLVDLQAYIAHTRMSLEKRLEDAKSKPAKPEQLIYEPDVAVEPVAEPVLLPVSKPKPKTQARAQPPVPPAPPAAKPTKTTVVTARGKKRVTGWQGFVLGVLATVAGFALYQHYIPASPVNQLTGFSVADLSSVKQRAGQLIFLPGFPSQAEIAQPVLEHYQQQIDYLSATSPLILRQYGNALVENAQRLWPDAEQQKLLTQSWSETLEKQRKDRFVTDGYYNAQQLAARLTDELLRAEEQKRSITISYLKSAAYDIQSNLDKEVPLEELLRQLAEQKTPSPVLIKQIDERFNSLLSHYQYLLDAGKKPQSN